MKNKKGFTLVEMLVVLSVLVIIFLIVVPDVTSLYKKLKQNEYERFLSDIFLSTEAYVQKNIDKYPELNTNNTKIYIYFEELLDSGYLKATIMDPKNKKNVKEEDYTVELFLNDDNEYKYKLLEEHYDLDYCEYESGKEWLFDYTGNEQEFVAPCKGKYKLEVWGAQGGTANATYAIGGYGSYSTGVVNFEKENKIFINVGGKGKSNNNNRTADTAGGYNGGGTAGACTMDLKYGDMYVASGGGATHIATASGLLSTFEDKKNNILIVSGGGGGGYFHNNYDYKSYGNGGNSGGFTGNDGQMNGSAYPTGLGGTQTSFGGISLTISTKYTNAGFGYGASGITSDNPSCGGGSGLYGGGPGQYAGCGGGSGYIGNTILTDKTMYCYSCKESTEESTKTVSTTCVNDIPTENCAKKENGYAKITYLG